ncbi:MAG TPA: ribbon-helix-helix domain-containing protein [Methylovirgula sp.]
MAPETQLPNAAPSAISKRSLAIAGHRTSISLEGAFWQGLRQLAQSRNMSIAALVAEIDAARGEANLSSAIRVFVLTSMTQEIGSLAIPPL